ncbi:IS110 family transposase [Calditerricola satsumensis]|uniref:IS110 family transposase n=1 Tax=Calditerricola satsumensis TaxID=373054 RepID=UPI0009FAFE66|nr:transposase [Calditerricola satsumensis]
MQKFQSAHRFPVPFQCLCKKNSGFFVVGMEPTGHYWLNLAAYLRACDVPVVLVNPFHVKQTKEFVDNSPTKNDRKDALVIGKLIKDGHFVIPTWPQGDFAELRGLSISATSS